MVFFRWRPTGNHLTDRIQLIVSVIVKEDLKDCPIPVCHRFKLFKLPVWACLLALEDIAVPSDVPWVVVAQSPG